MAKTTATFEYAVRDRDGQDRHAARSRPTRRPLVATKLKSMGYAPVSITQANAGAASGRSHIPGFGDKVELKDLAIMSPAVRHDDQRRPVAAARAVDPRGADREQAAGEGRSREVRNEVEAGSALSASLAKHPDGLPAADDQHDPGRRGRRLPRQGRSLQIADNYEAEVKLRGKVKSAMTYPVVVFVMAILRDDRHAAVHRADLRGDVRLARRRAAGADADPGVPVRRCSRSRSCRSSSSLIVVGVAVERSSSTTARVRDVVDPLKLKVPVFGPLFQKIALARFTRNLGTMIRSGVPILQALDIVADTTGNVVVGTRGARRPGERPAAASRWPARWRNHPVFPPMVVQMMAVGEDTGALDDDAAQDQRVLRPGGRGDDRGSSPR